MALSRTNPLAIEAVGSIEIDFETELNRLTAKIEEAERSRSDWIDKQRKLLKQRLGIRKAKNVPWPGCNNDSWPLIDPVIRRWKPGVANLVLRSEPVCLFRAMNPPAGENRAKAEEFYNWLFIDHIDRTTSSVMELVDIIAQFGKGYTRQGWDYKTERHSRIARVDSLFPGGIEQSLAAANEQIQQQAAMNPNAPAEELDAARFVAMVLSDQYGLSGDVDGQMIDQAVGNILSGARYVRLIYQSVLNDKPAWRALNPLDVIRPPRSEAIEEDDFIAITHRLSTDDIARMATDGFFDHGAAAEVIERLQRRSGSDLVTDIGIRNRTLLDIYDQIEGVQETFGQTGRFAEVWEIYAKVDIDGDGLAERVVLWYNRPTRTLLSAFEYPYPFREWPVAEFSFEISNRRPLSSRGIAEILSTHQKLVNSLHNARLDAIQVTTAPMFKVRSIGQQFNRNVRFRPGARIPVNDPSDIEPIVMDMQPLLELIREEQLTKTQAEQYIGIFDPSLTQLEGSGRERRTATEVQAVVSQSTEIHSQDAQLFQLSMATVHRQIWDLWEEFGPEEIFYRVLGEEQPKLARKSEISGDYSIIPAGSPISTNRAIVLQRAREMMQIFMQDQTGIVDRWELYREYFESQDFQLARRLLRSREEVQLLQQTIQAIQTAQEQAK